MKSPPSLAMRSGRPALSYRHNLLIPSSPTSVAGNKHLLCSVDGERRGLTRKRKDLLSGTFYGYLQSAAIGRSAWIGCGCVCALPYRLSCVRPRHGLSLSLSPHSIPTLLLFPLRKRGAVGGWVVVHGQQKILSLLLHCTNGGKREGPFLLSDRERT